MSKWTGNQWTVIPWHSLDERLEKKLESAGVESRIDETSDGPTKRFIFKGTLNDFAEAWGSKFIASWDGCWIAVTQFNSFEAR